MKILLRTPLDSTSGFGRDGIGLLSALLLQDRLHLIDVEPTVVKTPLPKQIADLFAYDKADYYDMEIHHINPGGAFIDPTTTDRSGCKVLWTMWEWDTIPETVPNFEDMRTFIPLYDHIIVYTEQSAEALRNAGMLRPDQKVSVLMGGIEAHLWCTPDHPRLSPSPFTFAMVGHLNTRKNVMGVLRAFLELQDEKGEAFDARLILKSQYPPFPQGLEFPNVRVISRADWTTAKLQEFYYSINCLVNASYGEGKDLPAMEATLSGTPTILNDTPGHAGWNHPGVQELIPTQVGPHPSDTSYIGRTTEVADIKAAMWDQYTHSSKYAKITGQMAMWIEKHYTWEARVKKLFKLLDIPHES